MSTLTLDKPLLKEKQVVLNVASCKYDFFLELMGNLDFVEVAEEEEDDGDSREEMIARFKRIANDVKLINEGKLKGRPARELLNEL